MNGLINIIIPVYNTEKFLNRCLNSILKQNYTPLNIYLIDDGSTDSSGVICDEFAKIDPRVTVIHKKNEGQGIARNSALDLIEDGYVYFVDSDDYLPANCLSNFIDAINNDYDIAISNIKFDNGIRIFNARVFPETKNIGRDGLIELYFKHNSIHTGPWAKLIKYDVIKNIRFPSFRCNEDFYILIDIFSKCNKIQLISEYCYVYNENDQGTERKPFSENKLNVLKGCEKNELYALDNYPEYYEYVLSQRLLYIRILLEQIIVSKNGKTFNKIYDNLIKDARRIFNNINNKKIISKQNIQFLENPYLFKIKVLIKSPYFRLRKLVKKCLYRLKNKSTEANNSIKY